MRNNNWNLVWVIIGFSIVIYSFFNPNQSKTFLGMSINIWVYRAIWFLVASGSLFSYLKRKKEESRFED